MYMCDEFRRTQDRESLIVYIIYK